MLVSKGVTIESCRILTEVHWNHPYIYIYQYIHAYIHLDFEAW